MPEPAVLVPSDPSTAIDYLQSDPLLNRGLMFLGAGNKRLTFSDGDTYSCVPKDQITVTNLAGAVTPFPLGVTLESRSAALEAAFMAMTDGSTLIMPQSGDLFEVGPIDESFSNCLVLLSGYVKNKNANQDFVYRFTGDHNMILGMNGFTDVTSGKGDYYRSVGNFNTIQMRIASTSINAEAGFAYVETETAIGNRILNSYFKNLKAGLSMDGSEALLQGLTFYDMWGPHCVQLQSQIEGGTFTARDIKIFQNDDALNTVDNFGGLNLSPMNGGTGQFDSIVLDDVFIKRTGASPTSSGDLAAIKLTHSRTTTLKNVRVDSQDVNGTGAYVIGFYADGASADFGNVTIKDSTLRVPIVSNGDIDHIRFQDCYLSRGNQTGKTRYYSVNGKTADITFEGVHCADAVADRAFVVAAGAGTVGKFTANDTRLEGAASAFLFAGQAGFDLNNFRHSNYMSDAGCKLVGLPADPDPPGPPASRPSDQIQLDNLAKSKVEGTFNLYKSTGGSPPPIPPDDHPPAAKHYTISDGARAISDDLAATADYYYNTTASNWLPITAASSGLTVYYKASGVASTADGFNVYDSDADIGPAPTVSPGSTYMTWSVAEQEQNSYYAASDGSAWIPITDQASSYEPNWPAVGAEENTGRMIGSNAVYRKRFQSLSSFGSSVILDAALTVASGARLVKTEGFCGCDSEIYSAVFNAATRRADLVMDGTGLVYKVNATSRESYDILVYYTK